MEHGDLDVWGQAHSLKHPVPPNSGVLLGANDSPCRVFWGLNFQGEPVRKYFPVIPHQSNLGGRGGGDWGNWCKNWKPQWENGDNGDRGVRR